MRISDIVTVAVLVALGLVLGRASALDGTRSPDRAITPIEAFRTGAQHLKVGETAKAIESLQYAAEHGHPTAQWKLGRMYADGDGVKQDDLRAYEYFSSIANGYADVSPDAPHARMVANAFVALGLYYLDGIPNTRVKRDVVRAREVFSYAASYFGDAEAQYNLGRLYFRGIGVPRDARQAARWLQLAANKSQAQAQALLGDMLFRGEALPRQAARGLMWLTLGRDGAPAGEKWVIELYDNAFKRASNDERALALVFLEQWLKGRRE